MEITDSLFSTFVCLFPLKQLVFLSHQVEYDGLTGHIEFNSKGQRTNYTLKILEKHPAGYKEVRTLTKLIKEESKD